MEEEEEVFLPLLPVAVGLAEEEEDVLVVLCPRLATKGREAWTSCWRAPWAMW